MKKKLQVNLITKINSWNLSKALRNHKNNFHCSIKDLLLIQKEIENIPPVVLRSSGVPMLGQSNNAISL